MRVAFGTDVDRTDDNASGEKEVEVDGQPMEDAVVLLVVVEVGVVPVAVEDASSFVDWSTCTVAVVMDEVAKVHLAAEIIVMVVLVEDDQVERNEEHVDCSNHQNQVEAVADLQADTSSRVVEIAGGDEDAEVMRSVVVAIEANIR